MGKEPKFVTVRKPPAHPASLLLLGTDFRLLTIIEQHFNEIIPEVEPIKATSEEQVLTYLNDCRGNEWRLPRMILLDSLRSQREETWRMLQYIKELPAPTNQVPVLLLGDGNDPAEVGEAYDRGVSSYLVKPDSEREWSACVQLIREYWWETVSLPCASSY